MKKFVLLLVLLLPVFGFSQTTLVRWDGVNMSTSPYLTASNISAGAITGNNVSFSVDNYGQQGNAFQTAEWPSSATPDYSKYVQVSISANSGYKIDLSQFGFEYQNYDQMGPSKLQVYYSKDSSFPSNGTLLYTDNNLNTTSGAAFTSVTVPLTGITVLPNETVYIRIAAYARTHSWSGPKLRFKHGYNDSYPSTHYNVGPYITGTVSTNSTACVAQGNQTTSPVDSWRGYVYSYSGTPAATTYLGYVTESETFNRNVSTGAVTGNTIALCSQPTDNFFVRYKMTKTFPAGTYVFTVGGDDGYRLKFGNETGYSINSWADQSYTTTSTTKTFSTTTTVDFVLEYYEKSGASQVSFNYTCGNSPTAPTSITTSSNSICGGTALTLTAVGGTTSTGTKFEWGTGTTVGQNILTQTTASTYTFTPTASASYWVRKIGPTPCNFVTSGVSTASQVTVTAPPTAPTSISGNTSVCPGASTTLTANGTSGTYEWGTGTVGQNIMTQTTASITVSPTSNTTYWVRVKSTSPCSNASAAATINVTITAPGGNPAVYGINSWNVYAYNTTGTPAIANYLGFYTQSTLDANTQDMSNNGWSKAASPSSSAGWNGCTVPDDNFTFVHKRQGFTCGKYQLYMDNWDDNTQVLVNGVSVFDVTAWSGDNPTPTLVGTYSLNETSKIDIITKEYSGSANLKLRLVEVQAVYNGSSWSVPAEGAAVVVNAGSLNVTENVNICSCTLTGTANVVIKEGFTVIIDDKLVIGPTATFTVENNASLVQINDNAANSGNVIVKRTTTPISRYDFTYWSSPLKAESGFLVGRDPSDVTKLGLSKNTFFDKYYSFAGNTQQWQTINYGNQVMVPGKGYIVRAPQEYAISTTPTATFTANFQGAPNNGLVTIPVMLPSASVSTGKSNLIGNPYPSAIDAVKFYNENSSIIDGTFYFWTHNIAVSSTPDANGVYQYNAASYLAVNYTGGTANGGGSPKASKNIASGQGFFVNAKTAGSVKFNNSMRVKDASSNTNFFRAAEAVTNTTQSIEETTEEVAIEQNRFWLNITNNAGAYNETLIGYVTGASNNFEDSYDGKTYASGTALYSLLSDEKMVIQGRALPFVSSDIVPLGFMAAASGEYSIGIESFDGLFDEQKIYLVDKTDNSIHNLKNERYTFTTGAGTFNSRFEIRYVNDSQLGVDTPVVSQNDIVVYKSGNQIGVRTNNLTIDSVQVYDITGKLLISGTDVNDTTFKTTGLNVSTQVLIVKVNLEDNQSVSKKIIMN